jgi:hypothetical protein
MMAAAYSTLISFIFLYIMSYRVSQKHYSIPFENTKVYLTILIGVILYLAAALVNLSIILDIIFKIVVIIVFPFILYLFRFFEAREINSLVGFYKKWKNPGNWRKNLKNNVNDI